MSEKVISLGMEDVLERSLQKVERKRYWDSLHPKEQGDVTIALSYLLKCWNAGRAGQRPSSAINDKQWKFVNRIVEKHTRFFTGGIGGFNPFI